MGESGTLDEIQDGHRGMLVAFARLSCGLEVLASHMGILFEIALGEALHEGIIQCPPGDTHERDPEELFFQKELQERHMTVKDPKQDQDV